MDPASRPRPVDLLIYAPVAQGGLAQYVDAQARELQRQGASFAVLAAPEFSQQHSASYPIWPVLRQARSCGAGARWVRKMRQGAALIANAWRLAWAVARCRPRWVLLQSYSEYLAPFWIWPHVLLRWLGGTRYAAFLHDPVRDYQLGPGWWHRLCVRLAYWPLELGFVHGPPPAAAQIPRRLRLVEVPHGIDAPLSPEALAAASAAGAVLRRSWGVRPQQRVLLAFGYVRDNKNLDLLLQAMRDRPHFFLTVAGRTQSDRDRPVAAYRAMARELGIADRVAFDDGFIPQENVAAYFLAADFAVLTYAASFHSQSGVLHLAARYRRPVLASGGDGPLRAAVEKFQLGVFAEPGSVHALARGLDALAENLPRPRWEDYAAAASWETNIACTCEAMALSTHAKIKKEAA